MSPPAYWHKVCEISTGKDEIQGDSAEMLKPEVQWAGMGLKKGRDTSANSGRRRFPRRREKP